ncbi:MAG: hypothetical protein HYR85_21715 [Planctomycetes bacterium]|nr:hypothetical protein [Planctomycetota bacterium]MBI3848585.1 hypothetical protein [Planctomycetota bacterium]
MKPENRQPSERAGNPSHQPGRSDEPEAITNFSVLFAKVSWALLGPLVLGGIAVAIATRPRGWFTWIDAAFAAGVFLVLAARTVDQHAGTATTAAGRRATTVDFRRFCIVLTAGAAVAWIAAHLIGG